MWVCGLDVRGFLSVRVCVCEWQCGLQKFYRIDLCDYCCCFVLLFFFLRTVFFPKTWQRISFYVYVWWVFFASFLFSRNLTLFLQWFERNCMTFRTYADTWKCWGILWRNLNLNWVNREKSAWILKIIADFDTSEGGEGVIENVRCFYYLP